MSKMLKIIELSNSYFSRFPVPESAKLFGSCAQLVYSMTDPNTNSKKKVQYLANLKKWQGNIQPNTIHNLTYQEKPNRVEVSGVYGSFLAADKHENILQDEVFGVARRSENGKKWVYIAKIKEEKVKSTFDEGAGTTAFRHDVGQRYTGTTKTGVFVLDTEARTITKINSDLIAIGPDFLDSEGREVVFSAFPKKPFGYGLSHCFNRQCRLYETNNGQVQEIPTKYRTNVFPRVSPCGNYMIFYGGDGITHLFYMNLVILKKTEGKWQPYHEIPEFYVGGYGECRSQFFLHDGKPYAIVQTADKSRNCLYLLDIQNKKIDQFYKNQQDQTVSIVSYCQTTRTLITKHSRLNQHCFGVAQLPNQIELIDPINKTDFSFESYDEPIPHFIMKNKKEVANRPVVVAIHGGPHGYADLSLSFFKYILLELGYAILMPNFSGSCSYGKKLLENALGKIGQIDAQEIVQCVQQLISRDQSIDRKRVYLYGGSYGGYMSGILGSRHAEHFAGAVLLNPVLSLPFMISTTDIPEWCTVEALNKEELTDLTAEEYVEMYRRSPLSQPLKVPGLVIVGQKDRRVPYECAKLYVALCKMKGINVELYAYPESDHRLMDSVDTAVDVVVKSVMFFQEEEIKARKKENTKEEEKREEKKTQQKSVEPQKKEEPQKEQPPTS